jgi:hypothetical protein
MFAQREGQENCLDQRATNERCCWVECLRERVKYSKLAKVGATRASDNQWDCGGAFARLRHGASELLLFVEFLVAEQIGFGRHGP